MFTGGILDVHNLEYRVLLPPPGIVNAPVSMETDSGMAMVFVSPPCHFWKDVGGGGCSRWQRAEVILHLTN